MFVIIVNIIVMIICIITIIIYVSLLVLFPEITWMSRVVKSLSNPKPGHTTGRSGRGGARRGGEGRRGWVGRDAVGSIQPGILPSSESKTLSWTCLRKHEQTKSYLNRWRNEIRGWSAGPRALFVPGCWPVCRRLFVFVNLSHARHVRENRWGNEISGW